ncbi:MAG: hypothetical protein H0V66_00650 [Bdellovibrionales bacterium]|nr:hypothetical protein [Bdellovibrionales bacterium]
MLKNRYQEILVGMGLMSLVRGLISLKRNRSTLLIDDPRFLGDSYHFHYLSEMEVFSLLRLGKIYDIPELLDLKQFLLPASVEFVTNDVRLRLGQSPFENLREVLRKFPELLDSSDLDMPYKDSPEAFNTYFLEELRRYETACFDSSKRPRALRFDLQGPKWIKTFYSRFAELINKEYAVSKDLKYSGLIHLLGISAEEKLKTYLPPEEVPFYFFRLLSPSYRLQDFFLTTQLKRRLLLLGGDYKESSVQFWQLHEHKFENLLLASFEGVISGDRVLFFAHLPEDVPFKVKSKFPIFRKNQMTAAKRISSPIPPTDLTFITHNDLLGSEEPYRVLARGPGVSFYHWPYPDLPGSKAEFYEKDIRQAYHQDAEALPFEELNADSRGILSVTMDLRELRDHRKSEAPVLTRLPLEVAENDKNIQGFEYWGPFRYRSLGLLALCYGIEGI